MKGMKRLTLKLVVLAATMNAISVLAQNAETTIEQMPAKLETQLALSALPPAMRDQATVYLLDPKKGYQLSRQGTRRLFSLISAPIAVFFAFRTRSADLEEEI